MPGVLYDIVKKRPDAVLCLNNSTQLTEYLALFLCKFLKIKYVWWTHGYDHGISNLPRILKIIKEKYVLFFLSQSNSIIVFSESGRKYLISKGILSDKVIVAHNTLDTDKIIRQKNDLIQNKCYDEIYKDLNLNITDKIVLFSGQLNKNKKVENAILAFENVVKKIPNAKLVIIGTGAEYDNLLKLSKLKIPDNSIFLGELFDDDVLCKWFSISQLFVMPGYVGLAIIHAFCFGLPIITEDLNYHSPEIDFLRNGKNGYAVGENNINELSDKIIDLLLNDQKRKTFSDEAFSTAIDDGCVSKMIYNINKAINIDN
jgi:glycosyltransferase involved in cell wall biosynthesis